MSFADLTPQAVRQRWHDLHAEIGVLLCQQYGRVAESSPPFEPMAALDERLVQAIWHDQMVNHRLLATASGKAVEVVEPGRWNTTRGPDFLDAKVRIAGELHEGDVEIHTQSADWHRHGHDTDFEYNRVVLHVVLRASDDRPYETRQNGTRLERVVLEPFLEPDLDTIRATIQLGDYPHGKPDTTGLCHSQLMKLPREKLHEFLLLSGRLRLEDKVHRLEAQRASASSRQLIYQALMTAQGYKASKTLYFLLSKRVPAEELLDLASDFPAEDRTDFCLAVLLHVSSQVEPPKANETEDDETQAFRARLTKFWAMARPYFSDRIIPPTKRWKSGMRPVSFPVRRLTAVARILAAMVDEKTPLIPRLIQMLHAQNCREMNARELKAYWVGLTKIIQPDPVDHYFETHYSLGGKKHGAIALMGEDAARGVLFNVMIPIAMLEARQARRPEMENFLWHQAFSFPALPGNSFVEMMEKRLFGPDGPPKGMLAREIMRQSLYRIFQECCSGNERTCDQCSFMALANRQ